MATAVSTSSAMSEGITGSPMAAMASLNSCRSSALSMASTFTPMSFTPWACQEALLVQLHGQGQARLAAQARQHAVRLLLFDDALDGLHGQRLQVDLVRQGLVGHDGGGVGVHQHHVHARRLQHAAGLGAGIVELRRLADHDGAGADHQYLLDILIQRHFRTLPSDR